MNDPCSIFARKLQAFINKSHGNLHDVRSRFWGGCCGDCGGDYCGEISMLGGKLSQVTTRATEDLEVMLIIADMATSLLERLPSMAVEIVITHQTRRRMVETADQDNRRPAPPGKFCIVHNCPFRPVAGRSDGHTHTEDGHTNT